MTKLQAVQATAINWHRKKPPIYKVGDKVWLSTKNIKTEKSSKKLNHKQIRLFKVKKLVEISYRLDLLTFMKIHNVFYLNLLSPMATNPLPDQYNPPPPPVVINKKKK